MVRSETQVVIANVFLSLGFLQVMLLGQALEKVSLCKF